MLAHRRKKEGPDQPRSWAIALAACVINTLLSGISRTTGLFYVALIHNYGVSRLQANLPFTVRNVVRNLSSPVVGAIGQRYGPREVTIVGGVLATLGITLCTFAPNVLWITILWGGMHGLGIGLGNTLFQVIVPQYFLKYRATASGLAMSGACLGSIVFPILIEALILQFGLSGTFLLTGGLVMHVLPAAIMLKEPPWIRGSRDEPPKTTIMTITQSSQPPEEPTASQSISSLVTTDDVQTTSVRKGLVTLLRNPMFHLISVCMAAYSLVYEPAITVIVDYLKDREIAENVAKYFISMLSLGDLIGRLAFGWVTDRGFMSIPRFVMLLQVAQGVCFLCLPLCSGLGSLIAVVMVYGITSGAHLVMYPIMVGKYLNSVQSLAIGCTSFLSGVTSFAIPPLIGYFRDRVGSYDGVFLITGGLSTIVGLCWLAEPLLLKLGRRLNPPTM